MIIHEEVFSMKLCTVRRDWNVCKHMKSSILLHTLRLKKMPPVIFCIYSVKNEPILMTFGTQNPEDISSYTLVHGIWKMWPWETQNFNVWSKFSLSLNKELMWCILCSFIAFGLFNRSLLTATVKYFNSKKKLTSSCRWEYWRQLIAEKNWLFLRYSGYILQVRWTKTKAASSNFVYQSIHTGPFLTKLFKK